MKSIELTGKYVSLIPMTEKHIEPIYTASLPTEIWVWSATKILSHQDAVDFVQEGILAREKKQHYPFVVIDSLTGSVIGSTSLRDIQFDNQTVEIGSTWYHPSKWRTAVNTECKFLLLQHAFETWQMNRVEFRTDELNRKSRAAITRLGALEEGMLRKDRKLKDGRVRNTMVYSILQEEWPAVKQRLEGFLKR
ncbi:GNAT family N-acetyltransferase [Peribacillus sp. NPDC097675]|uniref:GNAT family N-acetyltransferase n=1 Tax=Peribacillus sp. NPDC097675 TaxID=3390618 RepID=UPI003CFEF576